MVVYTTYLTMWMVYSKAQQGLNPLHKTPHNSPHTKNLHRFGMGVREGGEGARLKTLGS